MALVELLKSFGIHPTTAIGHSSREFAAAYSAGAIPARSALKLAYHRGRLDSSLTTTKPVKGRMMAVGISKGQIMLRLDRVANQCGYNGPTCIAAPKM